MEHLSEIGEFVIVKVTPICLCCMFLNSFIPKKVNDDLKLINANAASGRNRSLTAKFFADFIETHTFLNKLRVFRLNVLSNT